MVFFKDLIVPDQDRIGEEGVGFRALPHDLNPERVLVAAKTIGIGRATPVSRELALSYLIAPLNAALALGPDIDEDLAIEGQGRCLPDPRVIERRGVAVDQQVGGAIHRRDLADPGRIGALHRRRHMAGIDRRIARSQQRQNRRLRSFQMERNFTVARRGHIGKVGVPTST